MDRPPRRRQLPVGRAEKTFEVAHEPDVAAVHRELDPLPRQRRGEAIRFEPYREDRVAGLRAGLPRHPQGLRRGERAGPVSGVEQGPGMAATQIDRGVAGIPLDELAPLTPVGELAQPAPSEQERRRFSLVALQERLDLGHRGAMQVVAQPRELDVRKQRVIAETGPQPLPCATACRRGALRFDERGSARRIRHRGARRGGVEPRRAERPGDGHEDRRPPHHRSSGSGVPVFIHACAPWGRRPAAHAGAASRTRGRGRSCAAARRRCARRCGPR